MKTNTIFEIVLVVTCILIMVVVCINFGQGLSKDGEYMHVAQTPEMSATIPTPTPYYTPYYAPATKPSVNPTAKSGADGQNIRVGAHYIIECGYGCNIDCGHDCEIYCGRGCNIDCGDSCVVECGNGCNVAHGERCSITHGTGCNVWLAYPDGL